MHINMHMHTRTCTSTYTCAYTYTNVYTYTYTYTYTLVWTRRNNCGGTVIEDITASGNESNPHHPQKQQYVDAPQ